MDHEELENDDQELDDVLDHSFFNQTSLEDIIDETEDEPKYAEDYFRRITDL
ncbi:hypothetical protein [Marinoscillum sp. MHG1-6]|uniref:hypothetical protein n=1 Tax=Marinoscillum sp. MHG1-6 TaxID=2959627 RepID=UPI0021583773|nr:hypothetical protein [Marinoscillum sp. MHG1-6]